MWLPAASQVPRASPGQWGGMGPALGTTQRSRVSRRVLGGRHRDQSPQSPPSWKHGAAGRPRELQMGQTTGLGHFCHHQRPALKSMGCRAVNYLSGRVPLRENRGCFRKAEQPETGIGPAARLPREAAGGEGFGEGNLGQVPPRDGTGCEGQQRGQRMGLEGGPKPSAQPVSLGLGAGTDPLPCPAPGPQPGTPCRWKALGSARLLSAG